MGEYADMAIDDGFDELASGYRPLSRSRRAVEYFHYPVFEILSETDKGIHVTFAREDTGAAWARSFWWPKAHVELYDLRYGGKILMVPEWLLKLKLEKENKRCTQMN